MADNDVYQEEDTAPGEHPKALDGTRGVPESSISEYQDTCARCGKDYGKHRFSDDLCPGPFGSWDKSPGTTFRKRDVNDR